MILINSRLLIKTFFTFVCIVSTLGPIFYWIFNYIEASVTVISIPSSRSSLSCLPNSNYPSISSQISCNQCGLSLQESDDWFCDFDREWRRRKSLHHIQDQKERQFFFLHNWYPTIHCDFEQRIGVGDGGRWVCDIHKLQYTNSTPPLVYSFGSDGDFSFEKAIKQELPKSEIHTFDQSVYACPANICQFHQVYVGDGRRDRSKSLQMIMNDLNHQRRDIDILKVDIEGGEYNLFIELFALTNKGNSASQSFTAEVLPYIRQILVEIHFQSDEDEGESRRVHTLFENFRRNNYVIFHKEANIHGCQRVFEYAFIRLNPKFFVT